MCSNRSYFHRRLYERTITSEVTNEEAQPLRSQVFSQVFVTMERNGYAVFFQTWDNEEKAWGSLQLVDFTFFREEAIEKAVDVYRNAKTGPFEILKQM